MQGGRRWQETVWTSWSYCSREAWTETWTFCARRCGCGHGRQRGRRVLAGVPALVARQGLGGCQLVTSDANRGVRDAIVTVFAGASWQRCRTHFITNLPKGDKAQDRRGGPLPEPACGGQTIPDARFSDLRQSVAGGPDRTTEYLGIGV